MLTPGRRGSGRGRGAARAFLGPDGVDIIAGLVTPGSSRLTGSTVRNHDLVFLKHFSQVIAFLVAVMIALILLAVFFNSRIEPEENPIAVAATEARIRPVGEAYAGSTGAAAAAAAAEAAAKAAAGQVAYDGTLDGSVIYNALCSACHDSGAGGAPKLERAAWAARIAQGMDTLNKHAIDGFQGSAGVMPAKGGNPALTDEQVIATVQWMLDNLK
jgi:cytochrome c5